MVSLSPVQDRMAETKQSRKKDEQVMKGCETWAIRGLCMNEPWDFYPFNSGYHRKKSTLTLCCCGC